MMISTINCNLSIFLWFGQSTVLLQKIHGTLIQYRVNNSIFIVCVVSNLDFILRNSIHLRHRTRQVNLLFPMPTPRSPMVMKISMVNVFRLE